MGPGRITSLTSMAYSSSIRSSSLTMGSKFMRLASRFVAINTQSHSRTGQLSSARLAAQVILAQDKSSERLALRILKGIGIILLSAREEEGARCRYLEVYKLRKTQHATVYNRLFDDRANHMITDLLDANRIRAGQDLPIHAQRCELTALAESALDDLALTHGQRFVLQSARSLEGY